jgi:RNA polymerase sigma-70 factor (ECF subfamily)
VNRIAARAYVRVKETWMLEDRDIVRRCQEGQTDLMDILIDRHQTALYTLCRKLTGDPSDADDLFQDTWVRVMRSIGQFSGEYPFTTWLFRICVNRYRDKYRKRKRWLKRIKEYPSTEKQDTAMESVASGGPGPDGQVIQREAEQAVRNALARLDDKFRVPILLHYFRDLSISDVARILSLPDGTVKTRLARGREMLRGMVEDPRYA